MLGNATAIQLDQLTAYGVSIGLAFQIADDILDVEGDEEALGKPVGSDEGNEKSTYPALLGMEQAKLLAAETADQAVEALAGFGDEADTLRALALYIVERRS
jgi:geranylgeranyl diphosphate synthase type II